MILENIGLALTSVRSNKMRALLTMLGIIIGVMSVITIVTIGNTVQQSIDEQMADLGTDNLFLVVQEKKENSNDMDVMRAMSGRGNKKAESSDLLTPTMMSDMEANYPGRIKSILYSQSVGTGEVRNGEVYSDVTVTGVSPGYEKLESLTLQYGSFITENDVSNLTDSALVSDKMCKEVFGKADETLIGKNIKFFLTNRIEVYTIRGIYEYKERGMSMGDTSTTVYIPVSTAKSAVLEKNYQYVVIKATDSNDVPALTLELKRYFAKLYGDNDNWMVNVTNIGDMLSSAMSMLNTVQLGITLIAGISLLVGGIGVMNIMLVSVTERTREIGTRKALGAKTFHIRVQFITEAVIITGIGGFIGIIFGLLAGNLVSGFMQMSTAISPFVVVGSAVFSMLIGVFFGLYPANKAAKLNPIDALRYE